MTFKLISLLIEFIYLFFVNSIYLVAVFLSTVEQLSFGTPPSLFKGYLHLGNTKFGPRKMFTQCLCTNLLPLVMGLLSSGERDTFFGLRVLSLTSIQGTPWQSKSDCLQTSLISLTVHQSQQRQLSKHELTHLNPMYCTWGNSTHNIAEIIILLLEILLLLLLLLLLQCVYGTVTGAT